MNETRDLLERVGERFVFPDEAFERLERRRERKRRKQRIAAGVVGIAVFVAAVWIVSTGGPFDRTQPPTPGGGVTGPSGSTALPPHPVGVGLLGFPPEGDTPSAPKRGELVVGFLFGHTSGDPGRFGLNVYADGRVIWERLGILGVSNESTGLIQQRLTPEGVELVRAEVLSTGLLVTGGDAGRFQSERELVGPLGGLHFGLIEVRMDLDRFHRLSWGDVSFGDGNQPIETEVRPEDVQALRRLDARLEDLSSWLPASAWEDKEMRAYVPASYQVCYGGRSQALERPFILDLLPTPVGDPLRPLDTVGGELRGPLGPIRYWCSKVTTDEARAMAAALENAGASQYDPQWPSYRFAPPSGPEIDIGFDPQLPDY
jgi:hypothetical protein